jgi:hypothetical protein
VGYDNAVCESHLVSSPHSNIQICVIYDQVPPPTPGIVDASPITIKMEIHTNDSLMELFGLKTKTLNDHFTAIDKASSVKSNNTLNITHRNNTSNTTLYIIFLSIVYQFLINFLHIFTILYHRWLFFQGLYYLP